MRKYVLATHGKMAEGMLTTIEMLAGTQENLTCINAYTDECPDPLPELKRIVEANSEAEIVIMTDLLGGSVNNNASALSSLTWTGSSVMDSIIRGRLPAAGK